MSITFVRGGTSWLTDVEIRDEKWRNEVRMYTIHREDRKGDRVHALAHDGNKFSRAIQDYEKGDCLDQTLQWFEEKTGFGRHDMIYTEPYQE